VSQRTCSMCVMSYCVKFVCIITIKGNEIVLCKVREIISHVTSACVIACPCYTEMMCLYYSTSCVALEWSITFIYNLNAMTITLKQSLWVVP